MIIDKIEDFFLNILEKIGLKKLSDLYRKHQEGMRYLIFGFLATLVNILSYSVLSIFFLRGLKDESLRINISEIASFVISIVFAYTTNKLFVFKSNTKGAKNLLKEIVSFVGCRIFTEIISIALMNLSIKLRINDIIMKIVSNVIVIISNYILSKMIVFKKEKPLKNN